ncbi:transcriptional regulator, TetR family [Paenibacillus sp. OK060]|uniref:TetR/AcrR family transcriptional regulator n=1 Tax=Paenibacillus sp. OK060 TaxID=1881034 RepID=UPI00088FF3E2|nr:TetR/AcrR family transcriptional regulator [Paenibacillus sp. OK060]SDK13393.1 transcriptional regulator, TetR family [Paenibacillus sp. OK060]
MNKRKQILLDSALVLFGKHGVTNTSIQMILDESGVSKGTFYKFFGSKDDCILAILEQRVQEDMMIRKDLESQSYASDFDLLVDQIMVPMILPEKKLVVELFWTGFYSGECDLKNLTRMQLNWLSERLVQVFGKELKPFAYEGAIFGFGMIHQISNMWRNFHLDQPDWNHLVPKILNYIEILLRSMLERQEHIIDFPSLLMIAPDSKEIVLDKNNLIAGLQKFSHSILQLEVPIKAKELTKGLLVLVEQKEINISMLEVTLQAFQTEFESSSLQCEANRIVKDCRSYLEQFRQILMERTS